MSSARRRFSRSARTRASRRRRSRRGDVRSCSKRDCSGARASTPRPAPRGTTPKRASTPASKCTGPVRPYCASCEARGGVGGSSPARENMRCARASASDGVASSQIDSPSARSQNGGGSVGLFSAFCVRSVSVSATPLRSGASGVGAPCPARETGPLRATTSDTAGGRRVESKAWSEGHRCTPPVPPSPSGAGCGAAYSADALCVPMTTVVRSDADALPFAASATRLDRHAARACARTSKRARAYALARCGETYALA